MRGDESSRWVIALGIASAFVSALVAAGLVGWKALRRHFVRQYYETNYQPIALDAEKIGDYPARHHLDDVPWIATREPLCQSNSLQMIAAQRGIEKPRRAFDFLMGFTYGVGQIPGGLGFFPGTDPEPGFAVAAPYLGMVRHFYFTDDASQYLDAVRFYLAQGYPVRVGLDMSLLYKGMEDEMPHSEVLVGYDDAGFYYYETVCITPAPCEPGHRPAGEQGLYVSDQKLLDAVEGQAKLLYYPWRYSLSVFKAGELAQDLGPVWTRNGQSLIGGVRYGPRQGADVIEGLADKIEKQATRVDVAEIRPGLQVAVYVRRENATHLRTAFPAQPDLERAAGLFDQASGDYEAALGAIENGIAGQEEADEIAGWLRKAAAAEREAGQILLTRGAATG